MLNNLDKRKGINMEQGSAGKDFRARTCCFTGHREIPFLRRHHIAKVLKQELEKLIEQGVIYFGAGGALGFDTMAAQTVLSLKSKHPEIKLILVLPCKSQADRWSEEDRAVYEEIKLRADKVKYTSIEYTSGCMHKRNRHLVDNSSVCVSYMTKNTGGTAYTVDYARKNHVRVINLAEL